MNARAGLLALALAAGCSGTTIKPAEVPELKNPQEVRVLWRASVGDAQSFAFSPVLAGGSVYAAGRDGTVVRIDAASGKELWRVSAEMQLSSGGGADAALAGVASA